MERLDPELSKYCAMNLLSEVLVSVGAVSKNELFCTAKSNVADNDTSNSEYDIRFLISQPETISLLD
jgi:hypothetical protein